MKTFDQQLLENKQLETCQISISSSTLSIASSSIQLSIYSDSIVGIVPTIDAKETLNENILDSIEHRCSILPLSHTRSRLEFSNTSASYWTLYYIEIVKNKQGDPSSKLQYLDFLHNEKTLECISMIKNNFNLNVSDHKKLLFIVNPFGGTRLAPKLFQEIGEGYVEAE